MARYKGRAKNSQSTERVGTDQWSGSTPYYWWFLFLQRSERYRICCENGGKGSLKGLYKDFGDLRDQCFDDWWTERGEDLFAEAVPLDGVKRLVSKDDWEPAFDEYPVMVFAFDSSAGEPGIRKMFADYLAEHLNKRPGRPRANQRPTFAQYALNGTMHLARLEDMYKVLIEYERTPTTEARYWKLGVKVGIYVEEKEWAKPDLDDPSYRRKLSDKVGELLRDAKRLVKTVEKGRFPYDKAPPEQPSEHELAWIADRQRVINNRASRSQNYVRLVRQAR